MTHRAGPLLRLTFTAIAANVAIAASAAHADTIKIG